MPSLLVLNPVKRRRKSSAKKAKRRIVRAANPARKRSRRRNPISSLTVRKAARRHLTSRRRNPVGARRRRRNPISMKSFSASNIMGMLKSATIGGVGALGVDFVMSKLNPMLPASMQPVSSTQVDVSDAVKAGVTIVLGRALSKATKGLSEKMAAGALTVQAYTLVNILAAKFMPGTATVQGFRGMGYANPAMQVRGNARVSPNIRAFLPPGNASPVLNGRLGAYQQGPSPLLNRASSIANREGVKYR